MKRVLLGIAYAGVLFAIMVTLNLSAWGTPTNPAPGHVRHSQCHKPNNPNQHCSTSTLSTSTTGVPPFDTTTTTHLSNSTSLSTTIPSQTTTSMENTTTAPSTPSTSSTVPPTTTTPVATTIHHLRRSDPSATTTTPPSVDTPTFTTIPIVTTHQKDTTTTTQPPMTTTLVQPTTTMRRPLSPSTTVPSGDPTNTQGTDGPGGAEIGTAISVVAPTDDPPFSVPAAVGTSVLGVGLISLLAWWRIRKAEDDD